MKIALVSIGNEVLNGFTVNTNASFVAQKLLLAGYPLTEQIVLPDDPTLLAEGLKHAMDEHPLVLCMGGLGPTGDDITRKVVADLFQCGFRYDEDIARELTARYGEKLPSIENQATVPEKALVIPNRVGTAPGFALLAGQSQLILMPGVPAEMEAMLIHDVLPLIQKEYAPHEEQRKIVRFFNIPEVEMDPHLRQLERDFPKVKSGIYPSHEILTIHLITKEDLDQLDAAYQQLIALYPDHIFDSPSGTIEEAIHTFFIENKLTLSVAESCTGGSLSARLTQLPGASQYFLGSVISYSNELKQTLLDVKKSLLDQHGAVSEEVVRAMAQGAFAKTGCDYVLAVSGISGPDGGTVEKPVGTVWCALGHAPDTIMSWKLTLQGNRSVVITSSVNHLLGTLLQQARAHVNH